MQNKSEKLSPNLTFEIDSSLKLFNKLLEEYADFDKDHLNPRYAMNCASDSWHLTDWTYHEFHKNETKFQDSESINKNGNKIVISGLLKYQQFVTKECPELELMRLISNGTKHCILRDKNRKEKTSIKTGDFHYIDYSRHDYDVNRFIIEKNETEKVDFEKTLLKTIEYWKSKIK